MAKKMGLGRGLGELLGEMSSAYDQNGANFDESNSTITEVSVDSITPNPYQPRKEFDEDELRELSDSIISHGLIQPIAVYKNDESSDFEYTLIAGERRLRAHKLAKIKTIKVSILEIEQKDLRKLAIVENIHRSNLNPIELAQSYQQLLEEYDITHNELSAIVKKSRSQITNTLRLLSLSDYAQDLLLQEKITQGHAKILVGLDEKEQKKVLDSIVGQKLSVRESEELIKLIKNDKKPKNSFDDIKDNDTKTTPSNKNTQILDFSSLNNKLNNIFQNNDDIKINSKNNTLKIKFSSQKDLEEFIDKFK
jgi:ParB family chromosome partitioning protein